MGLNQEVLRSIEMRAVARYGVYTLVGLSTGDTDRMYFHQRTMEDYLADLRS